MFDLNESLGCTITPSSVEI